ncbi:MAG: trypsin-like peptidase domain-containing protein [Clostridia bacterium]|nr:trypsin-like peptidase domain-containing protein [Clostridia bacterium]
MKKRRLYVSVAVVLILTLMLSITTSAGSAGIIKIFVNEKPAGIDAKQINGEIYVPLKAVGESLGAKIQVSGDKKTVHISNSENSVASVINKVGPSVVGIIGNVKMTGSYYDTESREGMAFGTGVIIRSNGYIITNTHVVKDMENIIVVLSNSKAYQARLKAMDEKTDLAMIKIDKGTLTPAVFGEMSDIQVGEPVVAIGTPLSLTLRNSATKGIISGLNRSIQSDYKFIQSDAAINGGNSGGPIVNMDGRVIGINSIKYTGIGVEGLTFSIPIDTVKYAIDHFMKFGEIRRPYLGASFAEGIAARYGLPSNEGLTVTEIEADSPAKKYGLKEEDIIIAVNGINVTTIVDYNEEMKKYLPGASATLSVKRDEKTIKVKVVLAAEPKK